MNNAEIVKYAEDTMAGEYKRGTQIPLWDGKTAQRVVSSLKEYFELPS
jgi:hypothetical protein